MSLEFNYAFRQLPVGHSEKRYPSGMAVSGFFVSDVVLFGIGAAGMGKDGRVGCSGIRIIVCRRSGRVVDDPLLLMRSRVEQIDDMVSKVLWHGVQWG